MLNIHIFCVGKLKEKFYIDAASEYVKRLGRHCKIEIIELPEQRLSDNPAQAEIDAALAREAAMMYVPSMAVSIVRGATEEMYKNLAEKAVELAEHFEGEKLPRFTVMNLNAPKLPPEKVKPMVVCPLDTGYFLDTYELRLSPNNRPYYWVQEVDTAELPIEPTTPGSDRYFLQEGHMTCSFVGHFGDENGKYTEKMQEMWK